MKESRQYSIGELKRIIKEAKTEFEPLVYNKENEKINKSELGKLAKAQQEGDVRKKAKNPTYPYTDNKGMEDLRYDNVNEKFIDDNKYRRMGYVNKQAYDLHKNDPFGNAEFHDIDGIDDHVKMMKDGNVKGKHIGLTANNVDKKEYEKQNTTVDENKLMKLNFKNTVFMTENHMLSRVPDNYKVEGKKFIMKDKNSHEYLVEWHCEDDPKVVDKTLIKEQDTRIKELFNYKRGETNTTSSIRLTEDKKINDMLNKARKLMM